MVERWRKNSSDQTLYFYNWNCPDPDW